MSEKKGFLDFQVDHMTLLVHPDMYKIAYFIFRVIFGASREDILYDKTKTWDEKEGEVSMTFATRIGRSRAVNKDLMNTIVATVQPSEPEGTPSHVRTMLDSHNAAAHWQHIALRTTDLLAFHAHCVERGVNFVTPILQDSDEDLIQCFSGEWFVPGLKPSGMFFEFVQRNPNDALLKKIEERNRESWFRDKTFMGLYQEKENEYRSGRITPFFDFELIEKLAEPVEGRQVFEITEDDVRAAERTMLEHAKGRRAAKAG